MLYNASVLEELPETADGIINAASGGCRAVTSYLINKNVVDHPKVPQKRT